MVTISRPERVAASEVRTVQLVGNKLNKLMLLAFRDLQKLPCYKSNQR